MNNENIYGVALHFSACERLGGGVEWIMRRSRLASIIGVMASIPIYWKGGEQSRS
jgi:hypothetical protein